MSQEAVKNKVREFILEESPDSADDLTETSPLISSGVLNSLATLRLVSFLEENFGVELAAHEVGVDNMDTIADIASLVESKRD